MKKKIALGAGILILILGMTACGNKGSQGSSAGGSDTSKRVELVMWFIGDEPPKQAELMENLNKILIEKINATLKINWLSWADFGNNKYPLLFSSGEAFDMAYTATWLNFSALAQRGAFKDLDELFPKYAPKNYARQSKTALFQATVNGHIYAVPTLQATYSAYGAIYRTDLAIPYGWDGKMESFADIEKYFAIVKANNPGIEPFDTYNEGSPMDDVFMYSNGMYATRGSSNDFLFIDPFQPNPKIVTYYEYEKIPEFLSMMDRWNKAGYFPKSVLSDTDADKLRNGKAALRVHNIDAYEGNYRDGQRDGKDWQIRWFNMVKDVSNMAFTQDALAISNTAKNPERALMLWDLITNDEQVFRAFFYGIEGKSYEIIRENGVEYIEGINTTDYAFSNCWAARTNEFALPATGAPADLKGYKASYDAYIKDGVGSQKFRSFTADITSIETEYSACQNVQRQYWFPLELAYVDVKAGLKEYEEKMKAAGIEKVRQTIQAQLDAYIKSVSN
ncbi:putative ABC transporter substrate binding lipoprotein [Spirochaetia bacterium]|nr:putative ABC transporter substrate binding lipoprotein [Spirochaetia bacterium]